MGCLFVLPFLYSCTPVEYNQPAIITPTTIATKQAPEHSNSLSLAPATTLHAVLVGDTNDKGIGENKGIGDGVKVDLQNIQNLINSITKYTKLSARPEILKVGNPGDYDRVVQVINQLSVEDQDVVFFYYSGHGGRQLDKKSKWPALLVDGPTRSEQMLDLDWVFSSLQRKSPRLLIVMADACNTPVKQEAIATKESEDPNNYKKLFLGYRGHIIASSSIPDQLSYGDSNTGGVYTSTSAFLSSLTKQVATSVSEPSWHQIMQDAEKPITVKVQTQPGNPFSRVVEKEQQPQSEVDVRAITSVQLKGSEPSPTGRCSQNQYSPHPTDPSKECCLDDDLLPICAEK